MGEFDFVLVGAAAVYLGLLFCTRLFVRGQLRRRMYARVGDADSQATDAAPDVAAPVLNEVPATRTLSIELMNSAWSSDDGDTHAKLTQESRRLLRRSCLLDLVAVTTFFFCVMTRPRADAAAGDGLDMLVVFYLPLVLLRYELHRRVYWVAGADPWNTKFLGLEIPVQLNPVLFVLRKLTSLTLQLPLRWAVLAGLIWLGAAGVQAGQPWGWAPVFVALAVAVADVALLRRLRHQRGRTLLLLRVFHKDDAGMRSAVATFGGVLGSWLNFGAFFTVMDDSLLRYRSPIFSLRNVAVVIGIWWSLAQWSTRVDAVITGAVILAAWIIDAWLLYRSGLAAVVANTAEIPRIARQAHAARGLDLRFRRVEVPCLNSTWYPAVTAIAAQADVVLMDLRGYAPERTGCDAEVNLLFDAVSLRRIVFMIEPGKQEEIAALFERCWRKLAATSPNLSLLDPTVSVLEYPLDGDTSKHMVAEKQILLEELLFRTTGTLEGRTERAKRTTRWAIDRSRPGTIGGTGAPADAKAAQRPQAASLMARPNAAGRAGLSAAARAAVRDALARFEGTRGLDVGDGIPERKARNARQHLPIPPEEQLLALVDLTPFGSAKDCWAFTDVALRHCYLSKRYVVEYQYFPWRKFSAQGLSKVVVIAPDGSSALLQSLQGDLPRSTALEILVAVQAAVGTQRAVVPGFGLPMAEPAHPTAELSENAARAVRVALVAAKGRDAVYVGDELTEEKAKTARACCLVPPEEELVALVDSTAFRSAKKGWAFTDRALRYWDGFDRHVLEYKYFPERSFVRGRSGSVQVRASDGTATALSSLGGSVEEHIAMLEAVRSAVCGGAPAAAHEPAPRPPPDGADAVPSITRAPDHAPH